jgi:glycerol uptake facilitator-like aquaporin
MAEALVSAPVAPAPLWRRVLAEVIGTALLALAVVGSGIAAHSLAGVNAGEELGINAAVTAFALFVIVVVLAPVSGAHLNPVISLVDFVLGRRRWQDVVSYIPGQVVGCVAGAILANAVFGLPAISMSSNNRLSWPHLLSEVVATAGLVLVVFALSRSGRERFVAAAVGAYIGAAYFFASSTSFANPAITVGRMFTNTFSGIAPTAGLGFVTAQLVGGILGLVLVVVLFPSGRSRSSKPQE